MTLVVEDLLGLPVEDPHCVGHIEGERDGVPDAQAVGEGVALGDPDDDKQREGVELTLGLLEKDAVGVAQPLKVTLTVLQPLPVKDGVPLAYTVALAHKLPEAVLKAERLVDPLDDTHTVPLTEDEGERVPDAHTVTVPDALGEVEADKQRDAVGVIVGLKVADSDVVEQPLEDTDMEVRPLPENVPLGEPQGVGLFEVEDDRVPEAHEVGDTDVLGDPVALRHRDAVSV